MTDTEVSILPPEILPGWRRIFAPGIAAVRTLWKPFLLIQFCGLVVVVMYFQSPGMRAFCDHLGAIKVRGGWMFVFALMAFAAAIMPEVFKTVTGVDRSVSGARGWHIVFNIFLFGVVGLLCDWFYALMAVTFGDRADLIAITAKVLLDQLVFSTLLSLPLIALAYTWRECRMSIPRTVRRLGKRWYAERVGALLVVCWAYWFPMTFLMYALPVNLTFLFGAIASCASAMVLTAVAGARHDGPRR